MFLMLTHDIAMPRSRGPGLPRHHASATAHSVQSCGAHTHMRDRRVSDRLPFPGELVIVWNCDMSLAKAARYEVIDAGDGGFRIRADRELAIDMTGIVLRLLPDH